ncbi:MAG TPA: hypothetical protein VEL73_10780, partial [Mycobacteriales bacterium]|nr:hypothetical protein [Mycobacteriales bacterium]
MSAVFRILVVCSGNVCRSPLAERLLRARLAAALGPQAGRVLVTSAGTSALVGAGMDQRAAAVGRALGVDPDGFVARAVTAADVAAADLVLGATREHRAAAVRLHPPAHRYAFTVREFARLAPGVPPDAMPDVDPVHRARALVAAATALRGVNRAVRPEDDDVPDPHGGQERVHREVGAVLDRAVTVSVGVLAGRETRWADPPPGAGARPSAGPRRRAARRAGPRAVSRALGPPAGGPGGAASGAGPAEDVAGRRAVGPLVAGPGGAASGAGPAEDVAGRRADAPAGTESAGPPAGGRAGRRADRREGRRPSGSAAGRRRRASRRRPRRAALGSGLGVLAL